MKEPDIETRVPSQRSRKFRWVRATREDRSTEITGRGATG
jgi:hypothetical protein